MAWVYVLRMGNGQYYVGSTIDVDHRLAQHRQRHTKTTKIRGVETLVLKQEYTTLKEARSVESKVKRLKRKDYIEKMIKDGYIRILP